jgi:MFS family permease
MRRLLARLEASVGVFGRLAHSRDLRNVELAFLGFNAVEYGTWIAILLYAYDATGPVSVGVVALVQLLPAALFAPISASLGDRIRRERFLLLSYGVQTVTTALIATAMLIRLHPVLVYGLACIDTAAFTMTRPAQGALLPSLAETPEELTAANGLSALFEGAGILLGPLGAAVILAFSSPGAVFVAGTATLAIATLLAATVRSETREVTSIGDAGSQTPSAALEGFRFLARQREPRLLVGLLSSRMILSGALDVLFVLVALQLFHTGRSGAGILNAALGAGGMIGGAVTLTLVGRRKLGLVLVLGALAFGAPFAAIGLAPSSLTGPALVAASAIGLSLMDATGRTLLQRVVSDEILSRVFGVLEGLAMVALALGSILVSALNAWLGLQGTIVASAALLPVIALVSIPGLRRIDAMTVVPEREVALLARVAMFAPLRPQVLEAVARRCTWMVVPSGAVLITEGEPGDRYYVLASGRLEVTRGGVPVRSLREPGDAVGEIALLFDVPRTATVTVAEEAEVLVLERPDFLTAVTGHPEVARAAERVATDRMTRS